MARNHSRSKPIILPPPKVPVELTEEQKKERAALQEARDRELAELEALAGGGAGDDDGAGSEGAMLEDDEEARSAALRREAEKASEKKEGPAAPDASPVVDVASGLLISPEMAALLDRDVEDIRAAEEAEKTTASKKEGADTDCQQGAPERPQNGERDAVEEGMRSVASSDGVSSPAESGESGASTRQAGLRDGSCQPAPQRPQVPAVVRTVGAEAVLIIQRPTSNRHRIWAVVKGQEPAVPVLLKVRNSAFYRIGEEIAAELVEEGLFEAKQHRTAPRFPART